MSRFQRFLNERTNRVTREMMLEDCHRQMSSNPSAAALLMAIAASTEEKTLEQVLADLRRQGNQNRTIRTLLRYGRTHFDSSDYYDDYERETGNRSRGIRGRRRRGRHANSGGAFGKLR